MGAGQQRILITKVGMDAHWRGAIVISEALRDAGFEVIFGGNLVSGRHCGHCHTGGCRLHWNQQSFRKPYGDRASDSRFASQQKRQ